MLVDTHCHLYLNQFKNDLPEVYENAFKNGIKALIVPGINLETSIEAIKLAELYTGIYAAIGVHPNEALGWRDNTYKDLLNLSLHPKVVAIGEIGLDYYRNYCPIETQKTVYERQLELADQVSKPVIIHSRDAFIDVWQMLTQRNDGTSKSDGSCKGVFHSFSGTFADAELIVEKGYKIGITGPYTYKSAEELKGIVRKLEVNNFLVETDSPYLPPEPYRGKRNEPAYLIEIIKMMATQTGLTYDEISCQTSENARELFGIGALH